MLEIQSTENLDSTTQKIKKTIKDIAHSFYYIGLLLYEVRERKYYLEKGYSDVYEYAEKELMFKKTSTHNFISITERFSLKTKSGYPTMALDDKYDKYSYTQLSEMLSIKAIDPTQVINPSMSKREIREVKKNIKNKSKVDNNIVDVEFTEIQPAEFANQIDIITLIETNESIKVTSLNSDQQVNLVNQIEPITKQKMLDYINKRIVDMKAIVKCCGNDIEMKYKCLGQIDAFQNLYEEIYNDFNRNSFFE